MFTRRGTVRRRDGTAARRMNIQFFKGTVPGPLISTVETILLQQNCCNSTVATVRLQQYRCNSTVATVVWQQYCFNRIVAAVLLQQYGFWSGPASSLVWLQVRSCFWSGPASGSGRGFRFGPASGPPSIQLDIRRDIEFWDPHARPSSQSPQQGI